MNTEVLSLLERTLKLLGQERKATEGSQHFHYDHEKMCTMIQVEAISRIIIRLYFLQTHIYRLQPSVFRKAGS